MAGGEVVGFGGEALARSMTVRRVCGVESWRCRAGVLLAAWRGDNLVADLRRGEGGAQRARGRRGRPKRLPVVDRTDEVVTVRCRLAKLRFQNPHLSDTKSSIHLNRSALMYPPKAYAFGRLETSTRYWDVLRTGDNTR